MRRKLTIMRMKWRKACRKWKEIGKDCEKELWKWTMTERRENMNRKTCKHKTSAEEGRRTRKTKIKQMNSGPSSLHKKVTDAHECK